MGTGQSTEAVSQSDVSDCHSALFSHHEGLFRVWPASGLASWIVKATERAHQRDLNRRRRGNGASDGNRTRVACLEGRGSTIELHSRAQ